MSISYLEAIEREERNQADAARLIRDDEAEACAKIAEEFERLSPAGKLDARIFIGGVAQQIRDRIAARAKETLT